jgi:hypothetical protein
MTETVQEPNEDKLNDHMVFHFFAEDGVSPECWVPLHHYDQRSDGVAEVLYHIFALAQKLKNKEQLTAAEKRDIDIWLELQSITLPLHDNPVSIKAKGVSNHNLKDIDAHFYAYNPFYYDGRTVIFLDDIDDCDEKWRSFDQGGPATITFSIPPMQYDLIIHEYKETLDKSEPYLPIVDFPTRAELDYSEARSSIEPGELPVHAVVHFAASTDNQREAWVVVHESDYDHTLIGKILELYQKYKEDKVFLTKEEKRMIDVWIELQDMFLNGNDLSKDIEIENYNLATIMQYFEMFKPHPTDPNKGVDPYEDLDEWKNRYQGGPMTVLFSYPDYKTTVYYTKEQLKEHEPDMPIVEFPSIDLLKIAARKSNKRPLNVTERVKRTHKKKRTQKNDGPILVDSAVIRFGEDKTILECFIPVSSFKDKPKSLKLLEQVVQLVEQATHKIAPLSKADIRFLEVWTLLRRMFLMSGSDTGSAPVIVENRDMDHGCYFNIFNWKNTMLKNTYVMEFKKSGALFGSAYHSIDELPINQQRATVIEFPTNDAIYKIVDAHNKK